MKAVSGFQSVLAEQIEGFLARKRARCRPKPPAPCRSRVQVLQEPARALRTSDGGLASGLSGRQESRLEGSGSDSSAACVKAQRIWPRCNTSHRRDVDRDVQVITSAYTSSSSLVRRTTF